MFVLMSSRSSSKLGHLVSKTRSPGQISGKLCYNHFELWSECLLWSVLDQALSAMLLRWALQGHHGPLVFFLLLLCFLRVAWEVVRLIKLKKKRSKQQWIFTKLGMCVDMWRSGLGFLMDKFHQILTALSARGMLIFFFPDDNLSIYQGILTKLCTCIDMKEICLVWDC